MKTTIFTVGHSNHTIAKFVSLLKKHEIDVVADVRSSPQSRYNPQFNRNELKAALSQSAIRYVFLGEELGARASDECCYLDGRADYDLIAQTDLFRAGLKRLQTGSDQYRIALMCAEKDPVECHRTILVSRYLIGMGNEVKHILSDGSIERHQDTMERVRLLLGIPPPDMLSSREDVLRLTYQRQGQLIAYRPGGDRQKIRQVVN